MRDQTIFNKVVKHLRSMYVQSYDKNDSSCLYRSPEGRKCAIGCLIPNKDYHPKMEGNGIDVLIKHFPKIQKLFKGNSESLLNSLQEVHDEPSNWNRRFVGNTQLRKIAELHGLKYTPKPR